MPALESVTEKPSQFITSTHYTDFPESTLQTDRYAVLDTIGAGIGACRTEAGRNILHCKSETEEGGCSMLGKKKKSTLLEADFINSSLCQVLDFDDM